MAATVFTINNQKGGVGKTTTAVNLSAAMAMKGIRTLLVDLDPQANATSAVGHDKIEGGSLYGPLLGEEEAEDKVLETRQENLFLIPSEVDLAAIESELSASSDYLVQLDRCLANVRNSDRFDVIMLDCPPALGMLSMNGMACADYLIIALQAEYLALEGLGQIKQMLEHLREAGVNPKIDLGGIIITMFDIRTNHCRTVLDDVKGFFGDKVFKNVIPRSIRLAEAPSFGQTIFEYDRYCASAMAYEALGKEFIARFGLEGHGTRAEESKIEGQ